MLGCRSEASVRASRRKRSVNPSSLTKNGCRTLSATSRSSSVSTARYTSAMPPRPINCSQRYLPSVAPTRSRLILVSSPARLARQDHSHQACRRPAGLSLFGTYYRTALPIRSIGNSRKLCLRILQKPPPGAGGARHVLAVSKAVSALLETTVFRRPFHFRGIHQNCRALRPWSLAEQRFQPLPHTAKECAVAIGFQVLQRAPVTDRVQVALALHIKQ